MDKTQDVDVPFKTGQYIYTATQTLEQGTCVEKVCLTLQTPGQNVNPKCTDGYIGK